jgi:hypothetical protein
MRVRGQLRAGLRRGGLEPHGYRGVLRGGLADSKCYKCNSHYTEDDTDPLHPHQVYHAGVCRAVGRRMDIFVSHCWDRFELVYDSGSGVEADADLGECSLLDKVIEVLDWVAHGFRADLLGPGGVPDGDRDPRLLQRLDGCLLWAGLRRCARRVRRLRTRGRVRGAPA